MATKIQLTYCGMAGEGATVKEAKQDAARKIEALLSGDWQPIAFESRGWAIILHRSPDGWHPAIISDQSGKVRPDLFRGSCSGIRDKKEAIAQAIANLAQLSWDGAEVLPPCIASYGFRISPEARRALVDDFRRWRGFQLAYKQAAKNGMQDCEAHQWACHHATDFAACV
jgi:hypothetical protein